MAPARLELEQAREDRQMTNTPSWYGSIGVMNASHLHHRRRQGLRRHAVRAFAAACRYIGVWRLRAGGGRRRVGGMLPAGGRRAGRQPMDIRSR